MKKSLLLRSCAMFALPLGVAVGLPVAAAAQQITTEITGSVNSEAGAAVPGATVVITDTRTGATTEATASEAGRFSVPNLPTGGPYTVTARANGFQGQTVQQVFTSLQGATQLTFSLLPVTAEVAEEAIVVTASRARVTQLATGPGTSFGADVLEAAPTFNRDIRDIIRLDPRVSLDRDDLSGQDRISCLGGNDRGNAFTVDGITQSDVYGLNDTGFSARSSTPLPYDAIRETQVQFAPFDVEYGQFTGCAINVVTRSGTNKLRVDGFFEFTNDDLTGTELAGQRIETADFTDKRWGIAVGGPIIKDTLFVFGAYEKQKSADTQDEGPLGGGYSTELTAITEDAFNEVSEVLRTTYGIDPGPLARTLPFQNERLFGRVDWQIADGHRLEATYQRLDESRTSADDFFTSQNSPQVTGLNTFSISGSRSDFYSGRLYSRWSDVLSTELRYSRSKIRDKQDPIGGGEAQSDNPLTRIIVGVTNDGRNGTILAGPGNSRSANDLRTNIEQYKAAVRLDLGQHRLKGGIELNRADIFNLFVQNATGTLVFRNIADLRAGLLSPGLGNNQTSTLPNNVVGGQTEGAFGNFTASGDVTTAAAAFKRDIWSLYAQDEWQVNDRLNVVLGLRTDWFEGDSPELNPNFRARYGFSNTTGFGDIDPILLPRLAATYEIGDAAFLRRARLRAGVGIFSGGDPLVWFGNVFQNDGSTFGQGTSQAAGCPTGQIDVVTNGTFTGLPQCVVTAGGTTAAQGQGFTQSIDPDLKLTTVQRFNVGLETGLSFGQGFFSGWRLNADYIYSRYKNPFTIVDLAQAVAAVPGGPALGLNGFTIDGRPIYRQIDLSAAGCTGELVNPGAPPVFRDLNAACFSNARVDELMLTNAGSYSSQIASVLLSKDFGRGILTPGGNVYFSVGYAYTDAEDRRNMLNSTAGSNYDNTAAFDRQDPEASRGFYSQKHNIALSTSFGEEFFEGLRTSFGLTFVARSGRPYSLTFSGGGIFNASASGNDNALLYVPTGVDDPNLAPTSNPAAVQSLVNFVNGLDCARGFRGRTIERNSCDNDWFYDLDLRFSQELPGPGRLLGRDDKIEVYAMVDNFLNLLDDEWNVFRRRQFAGLQDVARLGGIDAQGRYVVSQFTGDTFAEDNQVKNSSSLWRLKVGVSYRF